MIHATIYDDTWHYNLVKGFDKIPDEGFAGTCHYIRVVLACMARVVFGLSLVFYLPIAILGWVHGILVIAGAMISITLFIFTLQYVSEKCSSKTVEGALGVVAVVAVVVVVSFISLSIYDLVVNGAGEGMLYTGLAVVAVVVVAAVLVALFNLVGKLFSKLNGKLIERERRRNAINMTDAKNSLGGKMCRPVKIVPGDRHEP